MSDDKILRAVVAVIGIAVVVLALAVIGLAWKVAALQQVTIP